MDGERTAVRPTGAKRGKRPGFAPDAIDPESLSLLAMASHEIRSQVNTVLGFSELLRETELDTDQSDYLERLLSAARRLVRFTSDIVDLASPRTHALEIRKAPFDLPEAVEEVCASMLPHAREKGLRLLCDVDGEVPRWVSGDAQRLQQVLINLMRNAIKFTDAGDVAVRVRATARTERFTTVLFSVSDTGIGISLERREAIFEAFEQESPGTRARFGGSGLGLAIARQLVQRMGGNLWVESEPGAGSTFFFVVRLQRLRAASEGLTDRAAKSSRRSLPRR